MSNLKDFSKSQAFYKLLIVTATVIWGFSFVAMKEAVGVLTPAWLLAARFGLTGLILLAVFHKRVITNFNKQHVLHGLLIGAILYTSFYFQTLGLSHTTAGKNAFLSAAYVVFIPFILWVWAKVRPNKYNAIAAVLCLSGIGCVALETSSAGLNIGDVLTLISAVGFAIHLIIVNRISVNSDILTLTVWQFIFGGCLAIMHASFAEAPPAFTLLLDPAFLWNLFYLVVFASCMSLVFMNVGFAKVPPTQGALLLSLEGVFGALFSILFYSDPFTLKLTIGFLLVMGSIIVSEVLPIKKKPDMDEANPLV